MESSRVDVSFLVVNYHSGVPLRRFFASLHEHVPEASWEVVVADNSPGDGVAEWLAEEHPEVTVLPMPSNVGYARAVNAGIERARGEHLLVINPDVEFVPGGVDIALAYLRAHPEVGLVGARLLDPDGGVQRSARRFYTLTTILLRRTPLGRLWPDHPELRRHLMLDDDLSRARPVDWVMGAWMLVRREAVERVGPMDGRFFLYFEDVDWCYRMWEGGYEVHYLPEAAFPHQYQRSSGKVGRPLLHHLRSFLSFYDKWGALVYVAKRLRSGWRVASDVLGDLIVLNLAFLLAFYTRRLLDPFFPEALFDFVDYLPLVGFTNVVSLFTLTLLGRYRGPRPRRWLRRWVGSLRAAFLVVLIVMAGTYLSHTRTFSRAVLLLLVPYYLLGLELLGALMRRVLGGGVSRRRVERLLLAGSPSGVRRLRSALEAERGDGSVIVGQVGDSPAGEGLRWLGDATELGEIVERHHVDEILVDGHEVEDEALLGALREQAASGTVVRVRHPWLDLAGTPDGEGGAEEGRGWRLPRPAACATGAWLKPWADRPLGLLLSLFALPGFVLSLALGRPLGWVALRPVRRLGRRRQPMGWSELVDPRSGRPLPGFLQAGRLAQLARGTLSLVGPRPLAVGSEKELGPVQLLRFAVKPGLTGPWSCPPGDAAAPQPLRDDLDYLQRWSPTLDLEILLRSLPTLFGRRDPRHRSSPDT